MADYLPGADAARRAALVVCNGGSMATQQALAAGAPVVGVASNMDQFLNMRAMESAGLGVCLRADRFSPDRLRSACRSRLGAGAARAPSPASPSATQAPARRLARILDDLGRATPRVAPSARDGTRIPEEHAPRR